jgi:acyl-CoA synthetase (NDP forming)
LTYCDLPHGSGVAIVTQSGGAGVLMADRAEELGLSVPVLSETTQDALRKTIPGFGACGNPVDVTGQFVANPTLLRESVKIVMADPQVHVGIVWLQLMDAYVDTLIAIFEEIKAQVDKPFVVCWVAASDYALHALRSRGIAVLRGAEPAVDAVAALVRYAAMRRQWQADQEARRKLRPSSFNAPVVAGPVPALDAAQLLRSYGVVLADTRLAGNAVEAVACADALGYPVALKIESAQIPHKTEAGGVALNLADAAVVAAAYTRVVDNARRHSPAASIAGVLVQRMAADGVEMVVGLHRDPVFGTIVMAGVGGIHVEVLKDVAFRKVPVTIAEAERMLDELKAKTMLDGVRGRPAADRMALTQLISAVSQFGAAADGHFAELDLNPVRVGANGAIAVDWLMICR